MKQNANLFIRIRDFLTSNEQILFVTFLTPVSTYCFGITADNTFTKFAAIFDSTSRDPIFYIYFDQFSPH